MSILHDRLFLLKNASVNRNLGFDDVCKEKYAKIVFYSLFKHKRFINKTEELGNGHFYGNIIRYPRTRFLKTANNVADYWEIEEMFLKINNIKAEWIYINVTNRGLLNETTGQWSGAVGLIQRDEADYAVKNYIPSYNMSKVAVLSPTLNAPIHWVTCRFQVSPKWNLLGLFTQV